jgi:hypothetical protein
MGFNPSTSRDDIEKKQQEETEYRDFDECSHDNGPL